MEVSGSICPDIMNSIDKSLLDENVFLTPTSKYYEHKYCKKIPSVEGEVKQRISFHSNRICLLSLAEDHPILKEDKKIIRINCQVSNVDRLKNVVSGKGKRGAQKLRPHSEICYIECEGGETFAVYSCIEGKLIEINKRLIDKPELLKTRPLAKGYLALILPMLDSYQSFKDRMLTLDEYMTNK